MIYNRSLMVREATVIFRAQIITPKVFHASAISSHCLSGEAYDFSYP